MHRVSIISRNFVLLWFYVFVVVFVVVVLLSFVDDCSVLLLAGGEAGRSGFVESCVLRS